MNRYDIQYKQTQLRILKDLENIYGNLVDDLVVAASLAGISDKEYFLFKNHPVLKKKADDLIKKLGVSLNLYINNQITDVWGLSNQKNDALVDQLFTSRDKVAPKALKSPNLKELDSFKQSKIKGLTISDRVWNSNANLRNELESSLNAALEKGQSAKSLAKDIKKYLNEPDKRFRRVRDKFGNLKPSANALQYNPGQGVYRSSQANALRLAGNEINRAYREAEYLRFQQNPAVVGFRIQNSNRVASVCPICERMNGLIFPKSFHFMGFHVSCRCTTIPILVSDAEFDKILNDPNYQPKQPDMPKEYLGEVYVQKARGEAEVFDKTSKDIAKKLGINVTDVNIKSSKRIFEKADSDYNGDAMKVKDIVRNTFVSRESKHESIINEISKSFEVDRIKYQKSTSDPLGYSGVLMNVKLNNGTFAEIQINSAAMLFGKDLESKRIIGKDIYESIRKTSGLEPGLGHKYYEEWRTLSKEIPTQYKRMQEIERLSKEYYNKLRQLGL